MAITLPDGRYLRDFMITMKNLIYSITVLLSITCESQIIPLDKQPIYRYRKFLRQGYGEFTSPI